MDDSPRSSKRRKLDAPKSRKPTSKTNAPKPSTRKSGRLQKNLDEQPEETESDAPPPPIRKSSRTVGSGRKGSAPGTPQENGFEDQDVYDDIEGALPPKNDSRKPSRVPSPNPAPKQTPKPRRKYGKEVLDLSLPHPSLPHPFKGKGMRTTPLHPTPARSEKENTLPTLSTLPNESESRTSFRSLVNGYKHGAQAPGQSSESLGRTSDGGTPVKRRPGRPRQIIAREEDEEESSDPLQTGQVNDLSPSKQQSGRRQSGRVSRGPEQIGEGEVTEHHSASPKKNPRRTRRANRTDHFSNSGDPGSLPDQPEEEEEIFEDAHVGEMQDQSSVAGSMIDPTEPSPFNRPKPTTKGRNAVALLQESLEPGPEVELLKSIVMERIMAKRPAPVVGLEEEYRTVYHLVEHTVTAGEGNSMLLIGARGSGKTTLVNRVLSEVAKDHSGDYHVVRLNGFIHTDDKIALREIWRQLGREMDIEEDGGVGKNYADTLTTLLALLSHPSETTGELTDQVAKAVIFVMDEFDLFAMHPRQTLLYNLFDIAQSRKAPIAVLGLTTRIDVANSLEKRVKSRFSHRYVHLSLAKSFSAFQEICKVSLIIQPDQLSIKERSILSSTPGSQTTSAKGRKKTETASEDILTTWNTNINSLFSSRSFLSTHLAPHYYLSKSVPTALTSFILPVATLFDASSGALTSWDNPALYSLTPPDSKISLLPSLSTLSLSLLIAAARLDVLHDADTCNFNMAYDEYVSLASKARIQSAAGGASASGAVSKVWGKEVARREWENLVDLGLLIPIVSGQSLGQGGFAMVKCDVSLEEIGVVAAEKGFERALERWCRQL